MESTPAEKKTARVLSVQSKMNNFREIQASLNVQTATYTTQREPTIMGIETEYYMWSSSSTFVCMIPTIWKLSKLIEKSVVYIKLKGDYGVSL